MQETPQINPRIAREILEIIERVRSLAKETIDQAAENTDPVLIKNIRQLVIAAEAVFEQLRCRPIPKIPGKPPFSKFVEKLTFDYPLHKNMALLIAAASNKDIVITAKEIADSLGETLDVIKCNIPSLKRKLGKMGLELLAFDDVPYLDGRNRLEKTTGYRFGWLTNEKKADTGDGQKREIYAKESPPARKVAEPISGRPSPTPAAEVLKNARLKPKKVDGDWRHIKF